VRGDETTRAGVYDTSTGQPSGQPIVVTTRAQRRLIKRLQRQHLRRVERIVIREEGMLPRD